MRLTRLFLLGASLLAYGSGVSQEATNSAGPSRVEIISRSWMKIVSRPNDPLAAPNSQTIERGDDPLEPVDPLPPTAPKSPTHQYYVYSATIVNRGPKTIKALRWNYTFSDPATHAQLRRQFGFSSARIGVNEKRTLEIRTAASPPKVVNVKSMNANGSAFEERASIDCIEFVDGSFWQDPNAQRTACDQLRNWQRWRRH